MKRLYAISFLLTLIFSLYSCQEPEVQVKSITLNSTALSLTEGESFNLTATVSPDNATDKTVLWSSSNASIASVDQGVVTAVKEGSATITATSRDGGAKASCEVTVTSAVVEVESVTLSEKEATLTVGKTLTLTATVLPENATDKTVTWTSNNPAVATVADGVVTAVKVGSASITATAGGKNASCTITVKEAYIDVTSVTLDKTSYSLLEGESFTLKATVKPDDASDKTVTWTSSDEKIITVYGGTVKAVGPGNATVTATAGKVSATCEVQVNARVAVAEVILDIKKLTLDVGQTETLTATVLPENATDKTVIWTSSDEDIATVRGGTVKGIAEGTATITATAGEKSASCIVTVKTVPLQAISLDKTELNLDPDQFEYLEVKFHPENATDKTVIWLSADESVAEVNSYGKVTAINPGKTTITAKAGDLTATCDVTVNNTNYLTIINNSKSTGDITIKSNGTSAPTIALSYSSDGKEWKEITLKAMESGTILLPAGGSIRLYGENPYYGRNSSSSIGFWSIRANVPHKLSGDIMSLCGYATDMTSDYQFYRLFYGDVNLESAESLKLSAKKLSPSCYRSMFQGCTALKKAPAIQARTLDVRSCESMFEKCTALEEVPVLPATDLTKADYCYLSMFKGCTKLTKGGKLPATTLAPRCYESMFQDCTALTEAPALPAEKLANYCYQAMFQGCTSLAKAPALNATTLAMMCYSQMFYGCTALKQAPELPAILMSAGCYMGMFQGCSALEKAPELPAKSLAHSCYFGMFSGCIALAEAPELPATKLAASCYNMMFSTCILLTAAPALPAPKLAEKCYEKMFYNCRNLNEVTCLATDISATDCTADWMFYTAAEGTFTKAAEMTKWSSGPSGIPTGWTVEDAEKDE